VRSIEASTRPGDDAVADRRGKHAIADEDHEIVPIAPDIRISPAGNQDWAFAVGAVAR
jgi:hypothetical protein